MKLYELSYVISQNAAQDEVKSVQERVNNFIVEEEGALDRIEDISKKRPGFLATVNFYLKPERIAALHTKLKAEGKITNFLVLNKKPLSAMDAPRRMRPSTMLSEISEKPAQEGRDSSSPTGRPKKVEIKEIEKKLEEILGE